MSKSKRKRIGLTEVKVDFSGHMETPLKKVFPSCPIGYNTMMDCLWAYIEKNNLSDEPFRMSRTKTKK